MLTTSTTTKTKTKTEAKAGPRAKATGIDAYLARLSRDQRAALEKLRRAIRAAAPGAEECISYQIPAFRYQGRMLVWFGATADHCALYPGAIPEAFRAELEDYSTSKGTIRFQPTQPLPASLVRKLVKARIAKNAAKKTARTRATTKRRRARATKRRRIR